MKNLVSPDVSKGPGIAYETLKDNYSKTRTKKYFNQVESLIREIRALNSAKIANQIKRLASLFNNTGALEFDTSIKRTSGRPTQESGSISKRCVRLRHSFQRRLGGECSKSICAQLCILCHALPRPQIFNLNISTTLISKQAFVCFP